ncbi:MAG TPA: adenylate/guanylate cyclase domain-containing protein [Methylomirabilota bacterium]|nr:adenylate/guanylate cyclase domain-containing protein [Methylomirabilota bacterium]
MRRRLTTLFVDIAGSTRLVVRHPPETVLGVIQCFAELVADLALAHGGRVKDFEGDGVLLYFESPVDAAEAALAIHAALERERCEAGCGGGPGTQVRMSLTLGDVAVGAVGATAHQTLALVGPSVNLGARLLKMVPPGGIAVSAEVVAALEREAPALAGRFRLLDPAFEVPGADGLTLAVYTLEEPARILT